MRILFLLLVSAGCAGQAAEKLELVNPAAYFGMADASGAVAVSSNLFLAADDESNALRLYRSDAPGRPVKEYDFSSFVQVQNKHVEADLEAGARIGDRAFWIGSHGRNKNGRERPNRGCFFATDLKVVGSTVQVMPVGRVYRDLLSDLTRDARFSFLGLAAAAMRTPKATDALNIEGLAATPEGHLLIGFRNPIPAGKALLIPLLNPNDVISGQRPSFGAALRLDLGGLGIRDIALFQRTYMIIGGPFDGRGNFELFKWDGTNSAPERLKVKHLNRYHPEALVIYPETGLREFQVLSDDGTLPVDGVAGKLVQDFSKKKFRSFWLKEP